MKRVPCLQVHRQAILERLSTDDNLILGGVRRKSGQITLNDHRFPTHPSFTTISLGFIQRVADNDHPGCESELVAHPLWQVHSSAKMKLVEARLNSLVNQV